MRRCIKSCGSPALPDHDLCLMCSHAELAQRARGRKRRRRTYQVSVSAETYRRLEAEARRRGQSVRSLMAEVLA